MVIIRNVIMTNTCRSLSILPCHRRPAHVCANVAHMDSSASTRARPLLAGMCIRIHARACVLVCVALRHRCRRRLDVVHMCTLIAVAAQAVDRTALSPPSTYPFHQAQQLARVLSCLACQYHCAVCCRCGESKRHRTRLRRDAAGCSLFGRSQAFG